MAPNLLIPDKIRFITLHGIEYFMPWEDLHPGNSFFIKTTATARQVQKELDRVSRRMGVTLKAVQRVEFGFYGARVWRLN